MKLVLSELVTFVAVFIGVLLVFRLLGGRRARVHQAILAAYRNGDYQMMLKLAEGLKTGDAETEYYLFVRGAALLQLGRLEQAESVLRRALSLPAKPEQKAMTRGVLAQVQMALEHWDAAEASLRQGLVDSKRGDSHRALAELLLRRDGRPEAALEAARAALAADQTEKVFPGQLGKEAHCHNLGESLAFCAWALARNHGDAAEVEGMIRQAFMVCGEASKPVLTELHFCAGRAYALIGNSAESIRHFKTSVEIDPVGNYGRQSQSMLAAAAS
jgi:tetratricopeptide (TPR) repeat protein